MIMNVPHQTTFALPLECDNCVVEVKQALFRLEGFTGISKVEADIGGQTVAVEGTAPASAIVAAIQSTGRDAILRGSGSPDSAAVCILETHSRAVKVGVRGLVRLVQVSPNMTVFDMSLRGLSPGLYHASVRESGDISQGPELTGNIFGISSAPDTGKVAKGELGTVDITNEGVGSAFLGKPVNIWEIIGRSIVVSRQQNGRFSRDDADTVVGVVARSAGVWENEKLVCSCSGRTVWDERREQVTKGML